VPQWYQEGFFEPGSNTLAYLDLTPPRKTLDDGSVITGRALFTAPTSRTFRQRDLYSTFFGTSINDEIERRLFGDIDARGSCAVRAFAGTDVGEWHRHFQTFFEYIDVQKIRTPKGLDWLRTQYPQLTQNELMFEMQGIRMMHCTIWTEGVREIVSAHDANVKFIISDHPVTIYNHAVPPDAGMIAYPSDPTIALRASQTIFPLNRDFCLILTNLEYAQDPSTPPRDKRTFARNYRSSMVRTDAFIRTRNLSDQEVTRVNYVLKSRARRYIAAGRKEWLFPEETVSDAWAALRGTFLPPERELWHFGGEMYAKFEDGHVHYQDEFGRTEKERDFLKKAPPARPLRAGDLCGCGSGSAFKSCCKQKSVALRPTWSEQSIRERNLMLLNGIVRILELDKGKDWIRVRRDITDEQIGTIYLLYEGLWPRETDLFQLLPKPDGVARAVYTGSIHPKTITEFALGAALYFGELIIEHPFLNAGTVKEQFSPVENPKAYRQEVLKTILVFLSVMPLVEAGLVNLVPNPGDFDLHLRDQMLHMARARAAGTELRPSMEPRLEKIAREDFQRGLLLLPADALKAQLRKVSPDLSAADLDEALLGIEQLKERDPLAVLQEGSLAGGKEGGQLNLMKLSPNFEMTMYLAQATGACIVTDSLFRWTEIQTALAQRPNSLNSGLSALVHSIQDTTFAFPQNPVDVVSLASSKLFANYPALIRDVFQYLSDLSDRGVKPNREAHLNARFVKTHAPAQAAIGKVRIPINKGRISCAFPTEGIQDNTVNRLLLMSSSERHVPKVPMAFFIKGPD
jgi:hypothetical protein